MRAGERSARWFLLNRGTLEVWDEVLDKKVKTLTPGMCFGTANLFNACKGGYPYTLRSTATSHVLSLGADELVQVVDFGDSALRRWYIDTKEAVGLWWEYESACLTRARQAVAIKKRQVARAVAHGTEKSSEKKPVP